MIKLGVNTVLFKKYTFGEAAAAIKKAGYDGLEISAIAGMCEHLCLDDWRAQQNEIKAVMEITGLEMLSAEVASLDPERLKKAFEAGAALGIPVINIGPGGTMNDAQSLAESLEAITRLAEMAEPYGVTLCVKAHVGAAVFDTPTTLHMMDAVQSPAFGVDMDPSHIYRAGEKPEEALPQVIGRVKHIHIRDCKGLGPSPGEPMLQACGRGDIDLFNYCRAMVDGQYDGPVCLEVIGPEQDMMSAAVIASESYGYLNACLKKLGAR